MTAPIRTIETTNSALCAFEITDRVERHEVTAIAEAVNAATREGRVNLLVIARGAAAQQGREIDAWLRRRIEQPQRCCRYAMVADRPGGAVGSLWPRWFAAHEEARAWAFVEGSPAQAPGAISTNDLSLVG